MKKTVLTLTTLAGLATLGANTNHADAAAYTIDEVNAMQGEQQVQAPASNQSYSYTYVINQDGSRTYNYSNGYSRTTAATSYSAPSTITNYNTTNNYAAPVTNNVQANTNFDRVSYSNNTTSTYTAPVAKKAVAATTSVNNNVASVARSVAAGKSYVFGGNSATAVDCSSFAQQVMAAMGKSIPRTTWAQMAAGTAVSTPQPGDLVYFNGGSHVGVYIGNGQMIDALNPQAGIGQRAVSYIDGSVTGYYRF
ncbi:C40 family peptidase [Macrococcus carouselicus]|uniref:Peptidoglycan endopeptidase n=1 Tax=Macrococcus carouselicus TaxID=69969 RepID=A0A9Q8CJ79_9STAP|nr:C40 family peptidase [Macrococcus carouselicus]TDL96601.1 peptidoglycan endopeptidase [Macrococcus carouselicus]